MQNHESSYSDENGDVRIWINEGGAISMKVVDSHNDPVELSEEEAMKIIEVLQGLIRKIQ